MRRTYTLSSETIKVVNGSATKVAEEFGCDPAYIHQILGQTVTDPFAKFEWLFASAVKAGCDVSHWLNRLEAIVLKYQGEGDKCIDTEVARFAKEAADVTIARLNGKPLYEQLAEISEAEHRLDMAKKAVMHAINEERETEGGKVRRFR